MIVNCDNVPGILRKITFTNEGARLVLVVSSNLFEKYACSSLSPNGLRPQGCSIKMSVSLYIQFLSCHPIVARGDHRWKDATVSMSFISLSSSFTMVARTKACTLWLQIRPYFFRKLSMNITFSHQLSLCIRCCHVPQEKVGIVHGLGIASGRFLLSLIDCNISCFRICERRSWSHLFICANASVITFLMSLSLISCLVWIDPGVP